METPPSASYQLQSKGTKSLSLASEGGDRILRHSSSASRLGTLIDIERKRLQSLWFLRFQHTVDEHGFLERVVAEQIKDLALKSWVLGVGFWIISYVKSYVEGRYLIAGKLSAAAIHLFVFQALQLASCQILLVIRFAGLPPQYVDTVLFVGALVGALTLPLCSPWRAGKWYEGDACAFAANYPDSPCPGVDWSDHYYLIFSACLYVGIACLLPVRAKWSACFGFCMSAAYFMTSFPQGWSSHSRGQVIVSCLSLALLTSMIWIGQRRRELKDRLEWFRVKELYQSVEELEEFVSFQADPAETSALETFEKAIRWGDIETVRTSRSSLLSLGWTPHDIDDKERSIRKSHSETFGISVEYVLSEAFTQICQRSTDKDDPTFYEISNAIFLVNDSIGKNTICPRDGEKGCSYLDTLAPEHKGVCTHFLSWSWSYNLSVVQSGLRNFIEKEDLDAEDVYLWMCFFTNNQHRILNESSKVKNGSDNLEEVFESNLLRIGKVVALLDTWIRPALLTRVWCIFEQYTAMRLGVEVYMILPKASADTFIDQIEAGKAGILHVKDNLSRVDSEHAKASMPADEEKVKQLIKQGVGFDAVNKQVVATMIKWMALEVQHYLNSLIVEATEVEAEAAPRVSSASRRSGAVRSSAVTPGARSSTTSHDGAILTSGLRASHAPRSTIKMAL